MILMLGFVPNIVVGLLIISSCLLKSSCTLLTSNKNALKCYQRPWWIVELKLSQRLDIELSQPPCPPKHFYVSGMSNCHKLLRCGDLGSIVLKELIGYGIVKAVYRAEWRGISIAVSLMNDARFRDDFLAGVDVLKILSPNSFVVQLIGFCGDNMMFTEYHKNGNALNIQSLLETKESDVVFRLNLCLNYAYILNYLHNSPAGRRVFCDSNDLLKLLSQLLITDTLKLVLNDLDALPEVSEQNNYSIKCGHKEIAGTFAAPEQLWPFKGPFVDDEMPGYDEKADIWKAAAVCEHFVGNAASFDVAQYYLFSLHKKCRSIDPDKRPSAESLVVEYLQIIEELSKNNEQHTHTGS